MGWIKVEKILEGNYGRENLLELLRQNIAGRCQQKCFAFLLQVSKLSHQQFEFLLKVKVMGSNSGYLLKSFLLYLKKEQSCF